METVAEAASAYAELSEDFGGELIGPEAPGYDEARRIFNGMIDRRPALVARPAGVADVLAAVRYAREAELPVAVRCGGHSLSGHSTADDALLLDLSLMKGVRIDLERRTARVQGGALWGEIDRETQAFGLATPGGRVTTTGVGGFTLGGGYGWLSPKYGLTCDNLISADLVTADGRFLTATEDENEELFWGLRGGNGNFGVVTSFEFRLHPVGPLIYGGLLAFPVERTTEVVGRWRDLAGEEAPDELATGAALVTAPPEEFVPEPARGQPAVGLLACWCGDVAEGERYLSPLKELAPLVDLFGPMPYRALQAMLDPMNPPGLRTYARGEHLRGLPDDAVEAFAGHSTAGLHPLSVAVLFQHAGAVSRVAEDATAFNHRQARFLIHPIAIWADPTDDERHIGWARALSDSFAPYRTGGVYLNFTADTATDRVRAAYDDATYGRLVALKKQYDPDNIFRFNQNIAPDAPDA
jgi:FAD/FMN-containing dehydrogenase